MKAAILIFILVTVIILESTEISFGPRIDRGQIQQTELSEASGLAVSGWDSQVLWTHNDSGGESAIYAMSVYGENLGKYYLEGISFRDVEDIACGAGPETGESYLYIADAGDNLGIFDIKYIYRVKEPEVSAGQIPAEFTIPAEDIEIISFIYESSINYDCETVFIDEESKDIWLVTRRNPENPASAEFDLVFRLQYPQSTSGINTAEEFFSLDLPLYQGYGITGGDLSSSGLELLLRTYDAVYYWERAIDEELESMFENEAVEVHYELEPQGEAVCWSAGADAYFSCGEEFGGYPAHLAYYARYSSFIRINQLPTGLYKSDEDFEIIWQPSGLYNQLYTSASSGGEILENYDATGVWGEDILISSPGMLGLSVGVYRAILHNPEYDYLSIEFPLIVESGSAPQMSSPPNGGTVSNPLPVFQWQVNPGVPYYLIAVSDTPFMIEHDENGEPIVTGIETVWQAITYETSIMYGMPDPSGYFEVNAPPLISGQEYNWIVANNYGNDPLLTSRVAGSPHSFYFEAGEALEQVELLTPDDGEVLAASEINFCWTEVEEAMYYQVQVFEIRQEGSNIGNYLVWDQVTTNTDIDMNAGSILIAAEYTWKVYATSAQEISSVSDAGHFEYDIAVGTLALHVRDNYGSAVPFATAEIDPIDGSSDDFPLAVNENGNESKTIPVGEYFIEVCKEGYELTEAIFVITENQQTEVWIEMEYSPSYFYGRVTDQTGYNLSNVTVKAENTEGEERLVTCINGNYLISVTCGEWTLSAEKKSWVCQQSITAEIEAGENLPIADLMMMQSNKNIQGYVRNTSGLPLMRCLIEAEQAGNTLMIISDANGFFEFYGLGMGNYLVSASKPGYTALNYETVNISLAAPAVTVIDDIILQPSAIINGTALNGLVGLSGVTITAIPAMGEPQETITDEYGDFRLNLLPGSYYLGANKLHYTNQSTYQVNLATGETLDNLDFILLPNDAYLRGNVTSEGSGLANVLITAEDNHSMTDQSGNYELAVYPGSYNLSAYKNGYTTNREYRIAVNPDQILEDLDFILYPNASIINGKAHHQGTGIAAAQVFAQKQTGSQIILSTSTNSAGHYSFSLLHGSYKLWAEKQNFVCLPEDTLFVSVAPGEELNEIDVILTPVEAYINGRVLNIQGLGLEGADIEIINGDNYYSTLTGNYGNFSVVVEPDYSYLVFAGKPGYSSSSVETEILEIGQETDLEIYLLQLPSTISGRVFNQNGIALQGVNVTAQGENTYNTTSSLNGSWLLSIFAGMYQVTAVKPGYLPDTHQINLIPGAQIDSLDFYLTENFAVLDGYVTGTNTGSPLPQVLVTASHNSGGGGSGYTNINGYFRLEHLLPGVYESVIFSREGYYSHIEPNLLLPGSFNTSLNVELEPFEAALFSLVNYMGDGMPGVTVAAENLTSGEIIYDVTDEQGVSFIEDIASLLPYEVSVSLTNYSAPDTIVYLIPGDTLALQFELVRIDGTLFGMVRDQENDPVSAVLVRAASSDGYQAESSTNAGGAYLMEGLAVNRFYTVEAQKQGYSQPQTVEIFLTEAATELDLNIYENNYLAAGSLVDQEDIALAGIMVYCQGEITGAQAQSDADGNFVLQPLAPFNNYSFWTIAAQNGYENISWEEFLPDENLELGEIIVPVHISIIRGSIMDLNTGEPLAGVVVTAQNQHTGNTGGAVSQPDGSYRIRYLYQGEYSLQAIKSSYSSVVIDSIALAHRDELVLDFAMQYNQPLVIAGILRDTDGRTYENFPVNMIVNNTTNTDYTNGLGSFSFDQGVPYSETIVTTDLDPLQYDNDWMQFFTTIEDSTGLLLEIDLHNARVNGQLSAAGAALSNVIVSLISIDTTLAMITGANGLYDFEFLYEGLYELSCYRPGYELFNSSFQLADAEHLVENVALEQIEGSISGVVGCPDEPALPNAVVCALFQGEIAAGDTTNAGGAFQINELPAEQFYQITVTKTGFLDYQHAEPVQVDDEFLAVELTPLANSLSGSVFYQDSTISDATAFIRDQNMDLQTSQTNQFGDFLFANISGYYDVWAVLGNELTSISQGVIIPAGGYVRFFPELIEAASISGLTIYLGEPKPGVTVTATNLASGRWARDITEQDGLYELIGLTPGNYGISCYCEGYSFQNLPGIICLSAGEDVVLTPVNLTFVQNSIAGIVQRINTRVGISAAEVTLFDSLHNDLETFVTQPEGTFLFSPLADGSYYVAAAHPAYQPIDEIAVELLGGISEPHTVDFNMVPQDLNIFGYVQTDDNLPISEAVVEVDFVEDLFSSRRNFKTIDYQRSFIDTTDSSGFYQVTVDTVGFWQICVTKPGFYESQPVTIELNWEQLFYQQNFYLQPIILYADICGSVRVWDEGWQPSDDFSIRLEADSGADSLMQVAAPDTGWCFTHLEVPDIFNLEVTAVYQDVEYYERREDIEINEPLVWTEDFTFTYIENSFSWVGYVYMQDEILLPLSGAQFMLCNSSGDSLITQSNSYGYYYFGNLPQDEYRLKITATYDDETFTHNTSWVQVNSNFEFNHTFNFLLAELGIFIYQPEQLPLPGTHIEITGDQGSLQLTTNSFGYTSSGAVLHTGDYDLRITPPLQQQYLYIEPRQQSVSLDTLGFFQYEKLLPLWLDKSDYEYSYSYDEEIPVYLYKTAQFTGSAKVFYRFNNGVISQLDMYAEPNRFYQTIPPTNADGSMSIWFRITQSANEEIYSSINYPYELIVTSEGIPAEEYSDIFPGSPVLPYAASIVLTAAIRDAMGNDLTEQIAADGEINWYLEEAELGTIVTDEDIPWQAEFTAGFLNDSELTGKLIAEIDYQSFHLELTAEITVGNFRIAYLQLFGPWEISNQGTASCNVRIYSESGRILSLPWEYEAIKPESGRLQAAYNLLKYTPEENFIGRNVLRVYTADPLNETRYESEFPVIVYDIINADSQADTLTTVEGCHLLVYDNMLKNTQTQAKLYLLKEDVPPYESVGVQYETVSGVFIPNSDQSETAFYQLPGMDFMTDAMVARWNSATLSWEILSDRNAVLEHIDLFAAHYSALQSSDELGIYDLKLLPNPFTPYDRIGANMGLQIQFRLATPRSRYVNITARVYTMSGQLVREITRNEAFLKGEYSAGELAALYWDGYTDGGRMARNGRYLIHIIAEDSQKKKEVIKSIVLMK